VHCQPERAQMEAFVGNGRRWPWTRNKALQEIPWVADCPFRQTDRVFRSAAPWWSGASHEVKNTGFTRAVLHRFHDYAVFLSSASGFPV